MNGRVGGNFEIYTLSTKYHYFSDAQGELLMEKGNNRNFQQTYTREIEKEWPYEFDFRVDQKEGSGNSEKNEKMWKRAKDMAVELRGMRENIGACIYGAPGEKAEAADCFRS